jgi:hypothetical protein
MFECFTVSARLWYFQSTHNGVHDSDLFPAIYDILTNRSGLESVELISPYDRVESISHAIEPPSWLGLSNFGNVRKLAITVADCSAWQPALP